MAPHFVIGENLLVLWNLGEYCYQKNPYRAVDSLPVTNLLMRFYATVGAIYAYVLSLVFQGNTFFSFFFGNKQRGLSLISNR